MGETQEEHDRKREYNYMTCSILKDRKMHMLASLHFNYRGNRVFMAMASAILTLIQTGLAILAQADLKSFEEDEDKWEKKWEDHQNNNTPYRLLSWLPFLFFGSHWSRTGIITGGPRFTILQQLRWGSCTKLRN